MNVLFDLFLTFAYLATISIGGAVTGIPEMERLVVAHGWMSHADFVQAFALSQLAPGPNLHLIFLIGYRVAGLSGALAAGLGLFGPFSLVLAGIAMLTRRSRPPGWINRFHAALNPVTIGLLAAAAWNLGQGKVEDIFWLCVCAAATLLTAKRLLASAWVVLLAAFVGALKVLFLG
ncbi:chromate transporter [Scytonema sp. PCC 10023]|uniref:chromate transporter n=1 Tax=Scytonema sp. PCC 10023 TaxID=1680591 RepID=UPI0039C5FD3C